jgi:hypothetical protein
MEAGTGMGEAVGILIFVLLAQLVLGLIVLVWVLARKLRTPDAVSADRRTRYIWASLGMLALATACDGWFLFGHNLSRAFSRDLASFSLGCLGIAFALALAGKGPGRVFLAVASLFLGVGWLPFILS